MLKAGNVERKSLSKRRSKSCDVVNGIQAKQDKTSASKNENRTSVRRIKSVIDRYDEVAKNGQCLVIESENKVKRAVEAVVFGDENEYAVALSNGAEWRIRGKGDRANIAMCNIGGNNAVSNISGAKVGKKVAVSSISGEVHGECVLYSAKVGEVMSRFGRVRATVGKVSTTVGGSKSGAKVGERIVAVSYISRAKVGESKEAVWMGSKAKVGMDVTSVACKSCSQMCVGVQKSENGRVDGSIESADWVSEDITSKNDQWVRDNGAAEHWCMGSANPERGRVLEVAKNVATLDDCEKVLLSLGRKTFSLCAMRTVLMRDRNI